MPCDMLQRVLPDVISQEASQSVTMPVCFGDGGDTPLVVVDAGIAVELPTVSYGVPMQPYTMSTLSSRSAHVDQFIPAKRTRTPYYETVQDSAEYEYTWKVKS